MRGSSAGWGSLEVTRTLVAGAALAVAFVVRERRARAPMLPMRLFASRGFSAGNAVIFFLNASLTGVVFFTAQFLQVSVGQDPLHAGLRLLPWGVAPFLIAPSAGKLADRIGERPLIVTGLLLQAAGLAWIAAVAAPGLAYPVMVTPMIVSGIGFALSLPAVTKAVVGSVPAADIGEASGAFSTMRQLGGAFGVAILAAVFAGAGSYASAAAFSSGFVPATAAASGLSAERKASRNDWPKTCAWVGRPPRMRPLTSISRVWTCHVECADHERSPGLLVAAGAAAATGPEKPGLPFTHRSPRKLAACLAARADLRWRASASRACPAGWARLSR